MHHMMDGDGAISKEKAFRKQRCLCNSSQKECNDNQLKREDVEEAEVLAWLLSVGDGVRQLQKRRCLGSKDACVTPL